eukprot:UN11641
MKKTKILVPFDLTFGEFVGVLRKRIPLNKFESIFVFVNPGTEMHVPGHNQLISDLYNKYQDHDGFLYIVYSTENTFGG